MKKHILFLLSLPFLAFVFACSSTSGSNFKQLAAEGSLAPSKEFAIAPAPSSLQDVGRSMKTAGYWVAKLTDPDKVMLTNKEINAINAKTVGASIYINNVQYFPTVYVRKNAETLHKKMVNIFSKYYDGFSKDPVGSAYFDNMEKNVNYTLFNTTASVRFAMTVKYAELRALPTREPLFSSLDTLDLDRVQVTQLDLASPLAVLYETKDKQWFYVASEIAEGWIEQDSIAFCPQNTIRDYKRWDKFAVTISPRNDIYMNKELTDFFDYVNMGTYLPVANVYEDILEVRIPISKANQALGFQKAYIKKSDASLGLMKYTQRNVLTQAFKHLNSPYGWGGMNGEQDCSSFLKQVFACFGIILPRNSTGQIQTGIFAGSFDAADPEQLRAQKIIKNGVPGMTLIYFPGHIMLYIGSEGGKPYIIHSIWGYGEDTEDLATTFLINRVAVTTMDVGASSKKGSLLKRTTLMKIIK